MTCRSLLPMRTPLPPDFENHEAALLPYGPTILAANISPSPTGSMEMCTRRSS